VPPGLGGCAALRSLSLHTNRLTELPGGGALGGLRALEEMHLGTNWLRELPAEMLQLPRLRVVSLRGNRLRFLPEDMKLKRLVKFDVANNELTALPDALPAWSKRLQFLDVSHNALRALPTRIGDFAALVRFNWSASPMMLFAMARPYATVFPEPVCADTTKSRPTASSAITAS
jgi:Leucine-rich repeat (LRR) protein